MTSRDTTPFVVGNPGLMKGKQKPARGKAENGVTWYAKKLLLETQGEI